MPVDQFLIPKAVTTPDGVPVARLDDLVAVDPTKYRKFCAALVGLVSGPDAHIIDEMITSTSTMVESTMYVTRRILIDSVGHVCVHDDGEITPMMHRMIADLAPEK